MHEMQTVVTLCHVCPSVYSSVCLPVILSVTSARNNTQGEADLRLLHCVGSFAFAKLLWPFVYSVHVENVCDYNVSRICQWRKWKPIQML